MFLLKGLLALFRVTLHANMAISDLHRYLVSLKGLSDQVGNRYNINTIALKTDYF